MTIELAMGNSMKPRTRIALRRPMSRHDAREIRRRAYALAQASSKRVYDEHLATLTELFEARGMAAVLGWTDEHPTPTMDEHHDG